MPTSTIGLPDGTSWSLSWDAPQPSTLTAAVPASPMPEAAPLDVSPSPAPSEADVQAALAKVPPRWTATAWRFVKTLIAGLAAAVGVAWASTGGTWDGLTRDPQTFAVALGTALLMAAQKALTWRD